MKMFSLPRYLGKIRSWDFSGLNLLKQNVEMAVAPLDLSAPQRSIHWFVDMVM